VHGRQTVIVDDVRAQVAAGLSQVRSPSERDTSVWALLQVSRVPLDAGADEVASTDELAALALARARLGVSVLRFAVMS
jgi:hypothetical protein